MIKILANILFTSLNDLYEKLEQVEDMKEWLPSMRSRPYWYQIGNKTCYIPKVRKFQFSSLACKVYFTDQNLMQRGDPMELNFEVFEIQKWNILTDRAKRVNEKNCIHLSIYHVLLPE